jgi:nitrile hydratase
MNGIHDLGGRHGFGAGLGTRDEGVFHAPWESRVFAIASLLLGSRCFNTDEFRHAIERLDPAAYLGDGYYGRWLGAVELLVHEAKGAPRAGAIPDPTAKRALEVAPRFAASARVRTRNLQPTGHTRLPAYVRGRVGAVVLQQGGWVLPDSNAHHRGERPEHVYAVRFEGTELWGDAAEAATSVTLDLFESYLEAA